MESAATHDPYSRRNPLESEATAFSTYPHQTPLHHVSTYTSTDTSLPPHWTNYNRGAASKELRRLHHGKAVAPADICPKTVEYFSAFLYWASVWREYLCFGKKSCLIPVLKKGCSTKLNDYRPVALTSHIMKTMERIVLSHLRSLVCSSLDPLQFAYSPQVGVEDAIIYMLQRIYPHLDTAGSTVRIMFFDFSSAFNTIQLTLLGKNWRECNWMLQWSPGSLTN